MSNKIPYGSIAIQLYDNGLVSLPLKQKSKAPVFSNWTNFGLKNRPSASIIEEWAYKYPNFNIGLLLGDGNNIIALDFDYDVDGLHKKIEDLITPSPVRKVGNKGYTAFYQYNGEKSQKWSKNGKTVLELLSTGRQTVLPPSTHPEGQVYKWITVDNLEMYEVKDLPSLSSDTIEKITKLFNLKGNNKNKIKIDSVHSKEDIASALEFIDCDEYERWVNVGMGLKQELGEGGFSLWDKWSSRSSKYNSNEMRGKFDSFNSSGITIATIIHLAKQNGYIGNFKKEVKSVKILPGGNLTTTSNIQIPKNILSPPGFVGEIMKWILDTSMYPQPLSALGAALTAVSVLLSHRVRTIEDTRTNLLVLSIAPSGSGKDYPRKAVKRLFDESGLIDLIGGQPKSGAGLLSCVVNADGRVLVQIDEIGRFLKSVTGKNASIHHDEIITNIMKLFSCSNELYIGDEYANHDGKVQRKDIKQPCLNVLGTTAPKKFFDSIQSEDALDGWLSRWVVLQTLDYGEEAEITELPIVPPELICGAKNIDAMKINHDPQGNLDDVNINPKVIPYTDEAKEILLKYRKYIRKQKEYCLKSQNDKEAIYARAVEHAIKISLILHDVDKGVIESHVMQYAVDFTSFWMDKLMHQLDSNLAENSFQSQVNKIKSILINAKKPLKRSDLVRKTQWLSTRARNEILNNLLESGELEVTEEKTKTKPVQYFSLPTFLNMN